MSNVKNDCNSGLIPREVVIGDILLFNCNIETIGFFSRISKGYYNAIWGEFKKLKDREVDGQFFRFIDCCKELYASFQYVNKNQYFLDKNSKKLQPKFFETEVKSLILELTYRKFGLEGYVLGAVIPEITKHCFPLNNSGGGMNCHYDLVSILKDDTQLIKDVEDKIKNKFKKLTNYFLYVCLLTCFVLTLSLF